MENIFVATILIVLATLGAMSIVAYMTDYFYSRFCPRQKILSIAFVKDCEEQIENIVRTFFAKHKEAEAELLVIDMGSTDQTKEELLLLCRDFKRLHAATLNDYQEKINNYLKYTAFHLDKDAV